MMVQLYLVDINGLGDGWGLFVTRVIVCGD